VEKRKLGKSDLEFAPIVFGGNVLGWTADETMSHRLLDQFVDAGYSFIDTADVYSRWAPGHKGGESEAVIGSWLRKNPAKRDKVQIATKCGMDMPNVGQGLSPAHVKRSVEASLKRMNTDRIDLFQSHRDDKDTPIDERLSTYGELIKAGKIRNYEAPRLAEVAKVAKDKGLPAYVSLQPHYNLLERPLFEGALEAECVKEGLGVIPYWPLAAGFLSGKYRSETDLGKSPRGAGVKKYLTDKGLGVLKALDAAAKKHNVSNVTVALAWIMQRKAITAPIASATNPDQLKELLAAPQLKLDPDSVAALDKASAA
jgi:aryl-alcohol dehydrogenase-like predicted oxidoreductase